MTEGDRQDPLVDWLRAIADPVRLSMLKLMDRDALAVTELCKILDVQQPAASHHLRRLTRCGLVSARRDGNLTFYGRNGHRPPFPRLTEALEATLADWTLPDGPRARLEDVTRRRAERSRRFFAALGDDDATPELVPAADYETDLERLLSSHAQRRGRALELGPGEGRLLPVLAGLFDEVVAADPVPERLHRARSRVTGAGVRNVAFRAVDPLEDPGSVPGPMDAIVAVMVLHHLPDPRRALARCAGALAPGGLLALVELCPHEQAWTRERCGDLWLGFEPDLLDAWAASAGLEEAARQFYAHRNGFRSQLRLFRRPAPGRTGP